MSNRLHILLQQSIGFIAIRIKLRIVEPLTGEIFIDDVNVLTLPLHSLRSHLSIVPQVDS